MSKHLAPKYYQKNNKRLQWKALERYQNLSKEEKEKPLQYGCGLYQNFSEDEKYKLVEYRKKIVEWVKMLYHNYKKVF